MRVFPAILEQRTCLHTVYLLSPAVAKGDTWQPMVIVTFCSTCPSKITIPSSQHMRDARKYIPVWSFSYLLMDCCPLIWLILFWMCWHCLHNIPRHHSADLLYPSYKIFFPGLFSLFSLLCPWHFRFCTGDSRQKLTDYCYELSAPIHPRDLKDSFAPNFVVATFPGWKESVTQFAARGERERM